MKCVVCTSRFRWASIVVEVSNQICVNPTKVRMCPCALQSCSQSLSCAPLLCALRMVPFRAGTGLHFSRKAGQGRVLVNHTFIALSIRRAWTCSLLLLFAGFVLGSRRAITWKTHRHPSQRHIRTYKGSSQTRTSMTYQHPTRQSKACTTPSLSTHCSFLSFSLPSYAISPALA